MPIAWSWTAAYCALSARAERGRIKPLYPEPDVPIEMPNTNLPSTH
jgi:hypothetical protein